MKNPVTQATFGTKHRTTINNTNNTTQKTKKDEHWRPKGKR